MVKTDAFLLSVCLATHHVVYITYIRWQHIEMVGHAALNRASYIHAHWQ